MAYPGEGPHIVHCPDDRLAAVDDLFQSVKGYKTLVDPVEMDDVGLAELPGPCYVDAGIGYVHIEKVVTAETVGGPDGCPFPQEAPLLADRAAHGNNTFAAAFEVADHHPGVDTFAAEGLEYASAGYRGATGCLGSIYKQDVHCSTLSYEDSNNPKNV